MSEVVILSGLPASGKTSRATEWVAEDPNNRKWINWDCRRYLMFGSEWKFNRKQEALMQAQSYRDCKQYLEEGLSVIIDNTNLTEKAREKWRQVAKTANADVTVTEEELQTPVSECVRRDKLREGNARVGRACIERMALFHGWIDWNDKEVYYKSTGGKDFVICDIDGTVANLDHRLHYVKGETVHQPECSYFGNEGETSPFKDGKCIHCGVSKYRKDWPAFFRECDKDLPIQPILDLVKYLSKKYDILFVSGRPYDLCGKATEAWLEKWADFPYKHLFMRGAGDYRPDYVVKTEIAELLPLDRVAYVIDDRAIVCNQTWRALGLTCLQVAKGEFYLFI